MKSEQETILGIAKLIKTPERKTENSYSGECYHLEINGKGVGNSFGLDKNGRFSWTFGGSTSDWIEDIARIYRKVTRKKLNKKDGFYLFNKNGKVVKYSKDDNIIHDYLEKEIGK